MSPRAMPAWPCSTPGLGPAARAIACTAAAHTSPSTISPTLRMSASRDCLRLLHRHAQEGSSARLRQRRVDLARQRSHLLCQLLVLAREVRVRVEQPLQRLHTLRSLLLEPVVAPLRQLLCALVTVGLAGLSEQDQRRRVRSLRREGEVQQDERVWVPVRDDRDRIERDPHGDDDRLAGDVLRRAEEPRGPLGAPPEGVVPECPVMLLGRRHPGEGTPRDGRPYGLPGASEESFLELLL